ncbi:hypothetical protein B2G71_01820 [Novosphingobium sp. PC22D]|nr:hypothetical protein B2G71_01820 [Novosphingobium sp. PC22D]
MFLFALAAGTPALAEPAAPASPSMQPDAACPASPAALSGEFAGWSRKHAPVTAAVSRAAADTASLVPGTAYAATLRRTPAVTYALRPARPGGSVSFGGLFAFTVAEPGTYRVAQDGRAWVDVIEDGAFVASSAHGHGPECSGIAKIVDYDLRSGPHLLQVSAAGEREMTLLISRAP